VIERYDVIVGWFLGSLSRQGPVNVVERLHTYYPDFVGRMDVV
jgi:hypothetical protein